MIDETPSTPNTLANSPNTAPNTAGASQMPNLGQMLKPDPNQPKVSSEEKMWALLSYIPLISVLALLIKPDSEYIRLHGRQGLVIFLLFFLCIFVFLVPFIGPLIAGLVQLGLFILAVFSMYQAAIGNWWKIPVLGDIAAQIPLTFFTQVKNQVMNTPTNSNPNPPTQALADNGNPSTNQPNPPPANPS